ncbi:MAG TPA: hypothetical protein VFA90_00040 [Terriglobales bacterium]|nr:hypothetical protein [Terriglobales bacterium]
MQVHLQSINSPNPMRSRNSVATVRITIQCDAEGAITIDDVTIMRTDGELWISMPRTKVAGAYVPFITLSTKTKLAISEAVLPAVEKWLGAQSAQEVSRG